MKMIYVPICKHEWDVVHQQGVVVMDHPQWNYGSQSMDGPLEEEVEVELPLEEEDEEDKKDLFIFKAGNMIKEEITFGK